MSISEEFWKTIDSKIIINIANKKIYSEINTDVYSKLTEVWKTPSFTRHQFPLKIESIETADGAKIFIKPVNDWEFLSNKALSTMTANMHFCHYSDIGHAAIVELILH
jgi:hypothetical protein